jgi:hypothetical protein
VATARISAPMQLPGAIRRGGRNGWISAAVLGAALAAVSLIVPWLLSDRDAFGFLAVWLGATGAVYLGFALNDGREKAFRTEVAGMALFVAMATAALAMGSAWLLAAGYLGHCLWDLVHHRRGIDTAMPWWWVPACLGYDAVVGAYILIRFL